MFHQVGLEPQSTKYSETFSLILILGAMAKKAYFIWFGNCFCNDTEKLFAIVDIMTIITNVNREVLLLPAEDLKSLPSGIHVCGKKHFYTLEGIEQKSPELVSLNLKSPMPLSQGEELQIWYGHDFADCGEEDNSGATCVDVYPWYI